MTTPDTTTQLLPPAPSGLPLGNTPVAAQGAARLASWPSAVWAEFLQLGVIRHPITLAVMLAVACTVLRIPGLALDWMGYGKDAPVLLESVPLVLCACAAWASVVWAQLRPEQRWFAYSLPVRHMTFLLARATAGALWLLLLLAIAIGASLASGDRAHFVNVTWLVVAITVGGVIAFCLVTALAIVVRIPLYVAMAVLALPLGAARLLRMNDMASAGDLVDRFLVGPYALFDALVGMPAQAVNGQFDVTPTGSWPVAAVVWLVVSLVCVYGAARVMSRR